MTFEQILIVPMIICGILVIPQIATAIFTVLRPELKLKSLSYWEKVEKIIS